MKDIQVCPEWNASVNDKYTFEYSFYLPASLPIKIKEGDCGPDISCLNTGDEVQIRRKFVDWEIKATLDKEHGLIGVLLPTNPLASNGGTNKPDRFQDNLDSGYAKFTNWSALLEGGEELLKTLIESAKASPKNMIKNSREMMSRNGTPPWKNQNPFLY